MYMLSSMLTRSAFGRYLALARTQRALHAISEGSQPVEWTQWDGDAPMYHASHPNALDFTSLRVTGHSTST